MINQPTAAPTRKVTAGALAGAVTILAVFVFGQFGVDIPAEVSSSVTVLLTFAASYVVRDRA